jgi:hypothetical protein
VAHPKTPPLTTTTTGRDGQKPNQAAGLAVHSAPADSPSGTQSRHQSGRDRHAVRPAQVFERGSLTTTCPTESHSSDLRCMGTSAKIPNTSPCRLSRRAARVKRKPATRADPYPAVVPRPSHTNAREHRAANAVALAFAQVVAGRYPGTSWLPVERDRRGRCLGMPSGKVVRLLTGPADHHPLSGIGGTTTPAMNGRAPYEHSTNAGSQ